MNLPREETAPVPPGYIGLVNYETVVKSDAEPNRGVLLRSRDFTSLLNKNMENDEDKTMMRTIRARDRRSYVVKSCALMKILREAFNRHGTSARYPNLRA